MYSSCPLEESGPFQNPKEIEKCLGWKAPTYGTSDFFNYCAEGTNVDVPLNILGEQMPFKNNGYLGAFFVSNTGGSGYDGYNGIMWWEYVQGQLTSLLEPGKIYRLSMEISLAEYSDLMISEMGAFFSDTHFSSPNTASLNLTPQCVFTDINYFSDTENWMHLEAYYQATGTEKFITIGNFRDNITTDTLRRYDLEPLHPNPNVSYYYIDNVQLIDYTWTLDPTNVFSPNGDGLNDLWTLPYSDQKQPKKVTIMNRWGNLIKEGDLNGFSWDGKTEAGLDCAEGNYFFKISNTNIAGFIQLIR